MKKTAIITLILIIITIFCSKLFADEIESTDDLTNNSADAETEYNQEAGGGGVDEDGNVIPPDRHVFSEPEFGIYELLLGQTAYSFLAGYSIGYGIWEKSNIGIITGISAVLIADTLWWLLQKDINSLDAQYVNTITLWSSFLGGLGTMLITDKYDIAGNLREILIGSSTVGLVGMTIASFISLGSEFTGGDVAFINSVTLWSTTVGFLIGMANDWDERVISASMLGTTIAGMTIPTFLYKYINISRSRMILIDASTLISGFYGYGIPFVAEANNRTEYICTIAGIAVGLTLSTLFSKGYDGLENPNSEIDQTGRSELIFGQTVFSLLWSGAIPLVFGVGLDTRYIVGAMMIGAPIGFLIPFFVTRNRPISSTRALYINSFSGWIAANGFLATLSFTEDVKTLGISIVSTLTAGLAGGVIFSSFYQPSHDDLFFMNSAGVWGFLFGSYIALSIKKEITTEQDIYSKILISGVACMDTFLIGSMFLFSYIDFTEDQILAIDTLMLIMQLAGVAPSILLDAQQFAGPLGIAGLFLGFGIGYYITRNWDENSSPIPGDGNESDDEITCFPIHQYRDGTNFVGLLYRF